MLEELIISIIASLIAGTIIELLKHYFDKE